MDWRLRSSGPGNRVDPRHLGCTSSSGAVSNAEGVSSSHHQFVPESIVWVQIIPLTKLALPVGDHAMSRASSKSDGDRAAEVNHAGLIGDLD